MMHLSFIIPSRNRAETLLSTLIAIENQTLDQWNKTLKLNMNIKGKYDVNTVKEQN